MIDLIDQFAEDARNQYVTLTGALSGYVADAIHRNDPSASSVKQRALNEARMAQVRFLDSVSGNAVRLLTQIRNELATPELALGMHEMSLESLHGLRNEVQAFVLRDYNIVATKLRHAALQVGMGRMHGQGDRALVAYRIKDSSPEFRQHDRIGRLRETSVMVHASARRSVYDFYLVGKLRVLSSQGFNVFAVSAQETDSEYEGLQFSHDQVDGLPSFEDIQREVFHPLSVRDFEGVR
jgi:hypothetical protein